MTQQELSKLSGISEVMISQYERGVRTPKNSNLLKIAYVFDKSGEKLLGEELPPRYTRKEEWNIKSYKEP